MGLDQLHEIGNNARIKGLLQPCTTQQIPGMDHQVNETEPQERVSRDVPHQARHELPRSCLGERLLLLSRGIDHRGDWIVAELIARDTRSRLVTINARQQQRSEAVPNHDVLNQLSYRDLRWRRTVP
jgi:hypothetical protein